MNVSEHRDGGGCWCDDSGAGREAALDRLFPDRCREPFGPGSPATDQRVCTLPAGHTEPHYGHLERPGGPCHFCGATYGGDQCPDCWDSLESLALADLKAIFAAGAPELSLDVRPPDAGGAA